MKDRKVIMMTFSSELFIVCCRRRNSIQRPIYKLLEINKLILCWKLNKRVLLKYELTARVFEKIKELVIARREKGKN